MSKPPRTRRRVATTVSRALFAMSLLVASTSLAVAPRPLALHPDNPHYFLFRGKPTILISSGEHYGAVLNLDFDYVPYLNELRAKKLNHTRLFSGTYREVPASFGITDNTLAPKPNRYAAPWARSTTPGYFDGGKKFDLTRWDEAYFRRLKDFVRQAGQRGIVVEINLFCPLYDEGLWQANPMNARNNINGVGTCSRNEVLTLKYRDLVETQKAVTRKFVAELQEFDNLYFEVCNEPWLGGVAMDWQDEIIATIVEAQSRLPNSQLISLNLAGPNIKNPNPAVSIFNYHHANIADAVGRNYALNKVIGDNETGFRGRENLAYRTEAWDCILSGGALFSSLDYSFTLKHPDGTFLDYKSPGGGNPEFRKQLRVLKEFIHGFDFIRMSPSASTIKSPLPLHLAPARVLAESGRAYAIYLRKRTDVDSLSVRWTGQLTPERDETLTFHAVSNDGVRLWLNDRLLIDNARDHRLTEDIASKPVAAGKPVALRMESYNLGRDAVVKLFWSNATTPKEIIPTTRVTPPDGSGTGFKGEYFNDRKLTSLAFTRNDAAIEFDWSRMNPLPTNALQQPVSLQLDLPAGDFRAEWIDPRSGRRLRRESFRHAGGERTVAVPEFAEDIALQLRQRN